MPRILVAGSGYVGGRLAELLVEAGASVWALRRSAVAPAQGVGAVRADLADPDSLRNLPQPLDGVVFCASPSSLGEDGYRRIFVDGLRHLIGALAGHERPPARLIFTSSTAVYGQSRGEWVDESSPTRPARFNGRVLLEAESLVHGAAVPGCVLRLGGIYGPDRTRRIAQVRDGTARLARGAPHYSNRIHREDAARSLMHLLALDRVQSVYLGVDSEPASDDDVTRFIAAELGLPEPPLLDEEPPRRTGSKRCRNDRLVHSGYRFVYPDFRAGYRALLGS